LPFYRDSVGFIVADEVCVGESVAPEQKLAAVFLRADVEHHSIAAFKAPEARFDHLAFETTCWNDIRDWADHFADMGIAAWWGPGRHGVGRNLFFMIKDPGRQQPRDFGRDRAHAPLHAASTLAQHRADAECLGTDLEPDGIVTPLP
jgi:hypothetical protein